MPQDPLLQYYNQELSYLRQQGEAFASAHPKVASRLRLGPGQIEDPFVGRMLESFAFLSAHLRSQLDEHFTSLSEAILNQLYPHYLLPLPSLGIIQFQAQDTLSSPQDIPAGTRLESVTPSLESCYFSSCYPVQLWPILLQQLRYTREVPSPLLLDLSAKACLSIELHTTLAHLNFYQLQPDRLRFYINLPPQQAYSLYEALFTQVHSIVLCAPEFIHSVRLTPDCIKPVGFAETEGLLPYPPQSCLGYRLLTELFALPQKFLFFDLCDLSAHLLPEHGTTLSVHIIFKQFNTELAPIINPHSLQLYCSPIVNLFEQIGEPIYLDQHHYEYPVIANAHRRKESIEVYRIESIDGLGDTPYPCRPYFSPQFTPSQHAALYWHAKRRPNWEQGLPSCPGTETWIQFSGLLPETQPILSPTLLCSNRDLPMQLPYGKDQPTFTLWQSQGLVKKVRSVCNITAPKYRHTTPDQDFVAHVSLNLLALSQTQSCLSKIKETLAFYAYDDPHMMEQIHRGLLEAQVHTVTERHPFSLKQGFCQGIEIQLTVDDTFFFPQQSFLLGAVLEQFFAKTCSVNAFSRLVLISKQRGVIHTWPARFGIKPPL